MCSSPSHTRGAGPAGDRWAPAPILRDSSAINRSLQIGARRKSKLRNFSPTFWLSKDILMFQQNISLWLVFPSFWCLLENSDNYYSFYRPVRYVFTKLQSRWVCNSTPHSRLPVTQALGLAAQTACKGLWILTVVWRPRCVWSVSQSVAFQVLRAPSENYRLAYIVRTWKENSRTDEWLDSHS